MISCPRCKADLTTEDAMQCFSCGEILQSVRNGTNQFAILHASSSAAKVEFQPHFPDAFQPARLFRLAKWIALFTIALALFAVLLGTSAFLASANWGYPLLETAVVLGSGSFGLFSCTLICLLFASIAGILQARVIAAQLARFQEFQSTPPRHFRFSGAAHREQSPHYQPRRRISIPSWLKGSSLDSQIISRMASFSAVVFFSFFPQYHIAGESRSGYASLGEIVTGFANGDRAFANAESLLIIALAVLLVISLVLALDRRWISAIACNSVAVALMAALAAENVARHSFAVLEQGSVAGFSYGFGLVGITLVASSVSLIRAKIHHDKG